MSVAHWLVLLSVVLSAASTAATAGAELPDGRAYELVSPGADAIGDVVRVPQMSEDGNIVAYKSSEAGPDAESSTLGPAAVARRTASGWTSSDANAPMGTGTPFLRDQELLVLSPDFTRAIYLTTATLDPADVDPFQYLGDLYRVEIPHGAATWISKGDAGADVADLVEIIAATPDLQRVVFIATGTLLSGGPPTGIYTSDASGVRLTSVLPDGTTPASWPVQVADQSVRYLGDNMRQFGAPAPYGGRHPISDDGRRVYFYDVSSSVGNSVPAPLYLRDGDTQTVQLAPSATFLAASHDGAVAYFESADQLTPGASVGGGIYRYDLATGGLTLLTPPAGDPAGLKLSEKLPPSFAPAMVSDDMSHIYFISPAALTPEATAGGHNLYRWSAAGTKFIAAVGAADAISRVTRDGRYAVLQSAEDLAGADTGGYQQLYLEDDATGKLACASCRPDGSASQGAANLDAQQSYDSPAWTQPRNLTDDGRLFFATKDRLVAKDVAAGADIYQYDHGALSLITPGTSDSDSFLGPNTNDGSDVFFMTRARLLPSDHDADQLDLYDARVGGGFPEAAPPPPPCTEDDCQARPSARPTLPAAATSTSTGNGNVVPSQVKPSVRISPLSAAQRARLARMGRASVTVRVNGGGTVTLRARGRLGGRQVTVGSGRRVLKDHGSVVVHVTLRLGASARQALARGRRLHVAIDARLSGVARSSTTTLTLARR